MMDEADKDGNGVIDCEGRTLHVSHPTFMVSHETISIYGQVLGHSYNYEKENSGYNFKREICTNFRFFVSYPARYKPF